jgi:hypothetical protein
MKVKLQCEYCGGPINGKPIVLEFASFQRFFCCITCKNNYREWHAGRIESIVEHYNICDISTISPLKKGVQF